MAKVGTSALESRKLGYLLEATRSCRNKDELLYVALQQAQGDVRRAATAPPLRAPFPVAGPQRRSPPSRAQLVNMRDGGFISAHDFHIAGLIADVVCGGDVDAGSLVTRST